VPRRLARRALADDAIRLEPLARAQAGDFDWLLEPDEGIARFTYIPTHPDTAWLTDWLGRYEDGWDGGDGGRAGFAVRNADGAAVGFAAFVRLDLELRQGEIGYVVAPAARNRGIASRAVSLLTRWGFDELGLERIELRIDARNAGSERVAERAGFRKEGVLRSLAFKDGLRSDVGVWSRLQHD
jgi:RimJ/RimL family protein N-acetyltransferase